MLENYFIDLYRQLTFYCIDAAYRLYRSKCEEESINKRGRTTEIQQRKRRHERIARVSLIL